MKYIFFAILILISSGISGQVKFCKPKEIEKVAKKIIGKLSKEDYQAILSITKDSAVKNQLFMVHKRDKRALKSIYKYLKREGCRTKFVDSLEETILVFTYYKIQKVDTCMGALLQPYLDYHKDDFINDVYIPRNLDECFEEIDYFWPDSVKVEVKNMAERKFVSSAHRGFGMWIRNNWGLWSGSRLEAYFNAMGIYHPDNMSGVILTSYHRYLNGKPLDLEEQIKYYQDYWKALKEEKERAKKDHKDSKNKN